MNVLKTLTAALFLTLVLDPLEAQTSWSGGSGNWSSPTNWSTNGVSAVPPPSTPFDNAQVTSANSTVAVDGNYTVGELTVGSTDVIAINDGQSLTVTSADGLGTINNSGNIVVSSQGNPTALAISGAVVLSGGGTVTLSNGSSLTGSSAFYTGTNTLDNIDNTIQGGAAPGSFSFGQTLDTLTNERAGTINANVSGQTFAFNVRSLQNSGTLEASNGGVLNLNGASNNSSFSSTAGTIEAQSGSTVVLSTSSNLVGTRLTTSGSGEIVVPYSASNPFFSSILLTNVTNAGTFIGSDGSTTTLIGASGQGIVNSGNMTFNSTGDATTLAISGAVVLSGGGTITLNSGSSLAGSSNFGSSTNTLDNIDNTIQGATASGSFPAGESLDSLTNESGGMIKANVSGQALALNVRSLQNSGTLEASNGAVLNLGGIFNNSSFSSLGGKIEAQSGSTVELTANSSIIGTLLTTSGSGKIVVPSSSFPNSSNVTLENVTNAGTFIGSDGSTTTLIGATGQGIVNSGNMIFNSSGGATTLAISGPVVLSGGGTVTLNSGSSLAGSFSSGSSSSNTLDNVDNTIQGGTAPGSFPVGAPLDTLTNETAGTINADVAGQTLALDVRSLQNSGTVEASNGGVLNLGGTFNSSSFSSVGGTIEAQAGSTVLLTANSSLFGTLLTTSGSGEIVVPSSSSPNFSSVTLGGVTNAGTFIASNGSTTTLVEFGSSDIVNSGSMTFNSSGGATTLAIAGAIVLKGGGTITLNSGSSLAGVSNSGTSPNTLDNIDNTIQGGAAFGSFPAGSSLDTLTNESAGTIDANVSGQSLALNVRSLQNSGTVEASNGGILNLGGAFNNSSFSSLGGTIEAQAGSTVLLTANSSLFGTLLTTSGSGEIVVPSSSSPNFSSVTLGGVTNAGTFIASNGSTTTLVEFGSSDIVNSGSMTFNSSGGATTLAIAGAIVLKGGGTITLNSGSSLAGVSNSGTSPNTLDNIDNTIQGGAAFGSFPAGSSLDTLTNESAGTIDANVSGQTLALNVRSLQNSGTVEASNGGVLNLNGAFNTSSFSSSAGTIEAQAGSTVVLSANSSLVGTFLTTSGSGKIVVPAESNPNYSDVTLENVTNTGTFIGSDGSTTTLLGFGGQGIINSGNMTFNSSGGATTLAIAGAVVLSGGGTVTLNGGSSLTGVSNFGTTFNTLDNIDNTIQGGGSASAFPSGVALSTLTNETGGTINANAAGQTLALNVQRLQNSGILEASNFGTLQLGSSFISTSLSSTAGTIEALAGSNVKLGQFSQVSNTAILAQDGGSVSLGQNAVISNSFMGTVGSGKIVAPASSQVSLANVTNAGSYVANDASTTTLSGSIVNSGSMTFNSTGDATSLGVSGNTTLSGGGTVTLANNAALGGALFSNSSANTLTNVDNTIQGGSVADTFPNAIPLSALTNETAATINANAAGETLAVNANSVQNSGILEATNFSTLHVTGNVINQSGALISATAGAEVVVDQGVTTNAGVISITAGTFDNGGQALNNTGKIVGFGTINTGGITNNGTITLAGGASTVNGDVTNAAGQTISVLQDKAVFNGNVVNNGTFRSTNSAATFNGTFTNNGAFITDPSTFNFGNLNIGTDGYIQGGVGDVFNVSGDITNDSTSPLFNISQSTLAFQGATNHTITTTSDGLSVATLDLPAGATLTFDLAAGTEFFVTDLDLSGGAAQLASLTVNGGTVFYDPNNAANAYLNNATYQLAGGGVLEAGVEPVPEPSTWALLILGACGLFVSQRMALRKRD